MTRGRRIWSWPLWSLLIAASYGAAWLLRFEFALPSHEWTALWQGLALAVLVKTLVFAALRVGLDRCARYATFADLLDLARANGLASLAAGGAWFWGIGPAFPRSIYLLDALLCFFLTAGARFAARGWWELAAAWRARHNTKNLLIYGAGVAGLDLAREIRGNPALGYRVVGFVDDDPRKQGARLLGLPVLGPGDRLRAIAARCRDHGKPVAEVVVAMPSATGRQLRAALDRGRAAGLPSRVVPGLGDLLRGKTTSSRTHELSVAGLLDREPVQLDLEPVRHCLGGRRVLVTGAAGSIGSELCRQLAQLNVGELVALDQAETEMFHLEARLRREFPSLPLAPEIGDIREARRMEQVIDEHGVDVVFHAAAYKHVPLMERQVGEAVRNNVLGTWNLVQAAWRAQVSRFLLISTDKAVNPSSVMGLTKRVAEILVSAARPPLGAGPPPRFVSVRFGNVLVSNGSVVPIFEKQIAAGGPVTVTHPEMRRYFMTVQEAVQLVLQAVTLATGSEIFVLDMGKPVRIVDLARKMILQAGLSPGDDIEIQYTGVRPGEKLYEDLQLEAERLLPTAQEKIRVFQGERRDLEELVPWITELQYLLWRGEREAVLAHLAQLVAEYRPAPASPACVQTPREEIAARLADAVPVSIS
jgi:FlaA1/EpsC-like NDP-sugar epimerase